MVEMRSLGPPGTTAVVRVAHAAALRGARRRAGRRGSAQQGPALRRAAALAALAAGCAHGGASPAGPDSPRAGSPVEAAGLAGEGDPLKADPPSAPLSPLGAEERKLQLELQGEVKTLVEFGPRSLAHSWNLAGATDHIARALEIAGFEVRRQGFEVGPELLQNLEVQLPSVRDAEALVVAAHYDTQGESPGANASASGAATLLVLAKRLAGKHFQRPIRLVWLNNESGPGGPGPTGSQVYSKLLRAEGVVVGATLTLGSLGRYRVESGTQRYPADLLYGAEGRTTRGDFVGVMYNAASQTLFERLSPVLARATLPVAPLILPESAPLANAGPQSTFWQQGWPGVTLTDTASFRDDSYDQPTDTLDRLDFDRLARVGGVLEALVRQLAGEAEPPALGERPATAPARTVPPRAAPSAPPPAQGSSRANAPAPSPAARSSSMMPKPAGLTRSSLRIGPGL